MAWTSSKANRPRRRSRPRCRRRSTPPAAARFRCSPWPTRRGSRISTAHEFHRVLRCYCKRRPCLCRYVEAKLAAEGLSSLDYEHERLPFVLTGNRGSGKINSEDRAARREDAEDDLGRRREILASGCYMTTFQRRVWSLHVDGASVTDIATKLRTSRNKAWRAIRDVRNEYETRDTGAALRKLASRCDRSLLELFTGLLRRAVEDPESVVPVLESVEALTAIAPPELIEDAP